MIKKYVPIVVALIVLLLGAGISMVALGVSTTPALASTPGPFVGSRLSDKYHYPSCQYVQQINPENKVIFDTAEEAVAAGYTPCSICRPPWPEVTPTPTPTPIPPGAASVTWNGAGAIHAVGQKWMVWSMTNTGNGDAWAAPFSNLYDSSAVKIGSVKASFFANGGATQNAASYAGLGWGAVPATGGVRTGLCTFWGAIPDSSHWAVSHGYVYDVSNSGFSALPGRVDTLP